MFSKVNDRSHTLCQGDNGGELTQFGIRPSLEVGYLWVSVRSWPIGEVADKTCRLIRASGKMSRLRSDSRTNK